jgi:hypothetical protein
MVRGNSLAFFSATFELALALQRFTEFDILRDNGSVVFDARAALGTPHLYVDALLQNFAKARDACGAEKQITRVEIKQAHAILTTLLDKASHIQASLDRFGMTAFMDRFTNHYAVLDGRSNKKFSGLKWLEVSPVATKKTSR